MQIKEMLKNKKLLTIIGIVLLVSILIIVLILVKGGKKEISYYYTFTKDDNLITQTVKIYDSNDVLQTSYFIIYDDKPVSATDGEAAVLTIDRLDLSDKQDIKFSLIKDPDVRLTAVYGG